MLLAVLLHEGGPLVCMAAASARPRAIRLQAGAIRIEKSGRLLTRREELRIAAGGPLTNLFCAGGGYIPVSYTHIDVYKRQRRASCGGSLPTVLWGTC